MLKLFLLIIYMVHQEIFDDIIGIIYDSNDLPLWKTHNLATKICQYFQNDLEDLSMLEPKIHYSPIFKTSEEYEKWDDKQEDEQKEDEIRLVVNGKYKTMAKNDFFKEFLFGLMDDIN